MTITRNQTLRTIGVLFDGVGVGTAAALLYAPQTGKRTRKDLRRYLNRKFDQFEDFQDTMTTYVSDGVHEFKGSISACMVDPKRAVDDTRASLVDTLTGVKKRFDDGAERFAMHIRGAAR